MCITAVSKQVFVMQASEQKGKDFAQQLQEKEAACDRLRAEVASLTLANENLNKVCLMQSQL